jgi:SSS family solute:Na+ symporter
MGLAMKIMFPEMPFVLRIGYVFIILSFVMVGMSLMDKSHNVDNVVDLTSGNKTISLGIKFVAFAMMAGIIAAFFVYPLRNLALECVYVLIVGFILIGLIMIFNNKLRKRDAKAIIINKGLFKTSPTFNIAAIGVCGILAVLYYFFW